MADIVESLAGNKMLMLKQDIAFLRKRLSECTDEDAKNGYPPGINGEGNLL